MVTYYFGIKQGIRIRMMREIGGYIEIEKNRGELFHDGAVCLNSGRSCLEYLIDVYNIKTIWLPKLNCDTVALRCKEKSVSVYTYSVNLDFSFDIPKLHENDWLYVINYYGQLDTERINRIRLVHSNVIVDNVQAFYQSPIDGVPTFYTCRKFFGVPDGAFLYTEKHIKNKLELDVSYDRMSHLLGRFEKKAEDFYDSYKENESKFIEIPMREMSRLTENLLRGINYRDIKKRREDNWGFLHNGLAEINMLKINRVPGPFAYPLFVDNGVLIRKKLIERNIFIPILWPNVLEENDEESAEYQLANNILPLPVDQRYDENDMGYVLESIMELI